MYKDKKFAVADFENLVLTRRLNFVELQLILSRKVEIFTVTRKRRPQKNCEDFFQDETCSKT